MKFEIQKQRDGSGRFVQAVVGIVGRATITILMEAGEDATSLASILNGAGVKGINVDSPVRAVAWKHVSVGEAFTFDAGGAVFVRCRGGFRPGCGGELCPAPADPLTAVYPWVT
jgi:hypothetical protein